MSEVAREKTPYTREQLAETLRDEIDAKFPGAVNQDMLAMLAAQIWIETANGSKLFNNNPGNLIRSNPSAASPGQWYRPTWWTDTSSKLHAKAHAKPPTAPQAFRAYMTLNDGMADYLDLLNNPRFEELIIAARAGNPVRYGEAIKASGYAPDWGPANTRNLTGLYELAKGEFFPDEPETVEVDPKDNNALAGLLAAGAVFVGAKWIFRKK